MKAMILKELHESGKWALLLMLLFGVALWWEVGTYGDFSIVRQTVIGLCMVGCPLVALALGMIQIAYDWPLARWSFITHRPISRSRIFWAKTIAGLALYTLATGVPLLGALFTVLIPWSGHAPFSWNMTLPTIALWFHGILYYFVAILIATREARWYATRLAPLGGAILLSLLAIVVTLNFVEVFIVLIAGVCMLIPPALGGFVSAGQFDRQPPASRALHVLTITGTTVLGLFILAGLTHQLIRSIPRMPSNYFLQSYNIDADGRIVLASYTAGSVDYTDLEGNPLSPPPIFYQGSAFEMHGSPSLYFSGRFTRIPNERGRMPHWNSLSYLWPLESSAHQKWYYVPARQRIEGMNLYTGLTIGTIGRDGLNDAAASFRNPLVLERLPLILEGNRAFMFDGGNSSLHLIAEIEPNQRILDATAVRPPPGSNASQPTYFLLTDSAIYGFQDGTKALRFPLDQNKDQYSNFTITPTRQGTFVLLYSHPLVFGTPGQIVVELSQTGEVLRNTQLPPLNYSPPMDPPWRAHLMGAAQILFTPPPFTWWRMIRLSYTSAQLGVVPTGIWFHSAGALGILLICVVDILLLSRRLKFTRSQTVGWISLAALTGFAAILTLHMTRTRPTRIKCPACEKPRTTSGQTCEHCAAPHAVPSRTGIEILEPMPAT